MDRSERENTFSGHYGPSAPILRVMRRDPVVINHRYEPNTDFELDFEDDFEPDFEDVLDPFGHQNERFIDAFGGCCASLAVLLNNLADLDPAEPFDASNDIVRQLCLVAGTVGYPISGEYMPTTTRF